MLGHTFNVQKAEANRDKLVSLAQDGRMNLLLDMGITPTEST